MKPCRSCATLSYLTPAQQVIAHRMLEKDLSQAVFDMARDYGWLAARYPTWRPTGTAAGVPDLLLVRAGEEIIFAELKNQHGKFTTAQDEWANALKGVAEGRVLYFTWRPSHLLGGAIEAVLAWEPRAGA